MVLTTTPEEQLTAETHPLLPETTGKSTRPKSSASDWVTQWSTLTLNFTVWISAILFRLYILAFYVVAIPEGDLRRWNTVLKDLYVEKTEAANIAIGLHLLGGAIILVLGGVQFISGIRKQYPLVHRWTGRVYITACVVTAIGGLVFIGIRGTVGGVVADIGFSLYGILMFVCALQTVRYARARLLITHREWAMRLYSLALSSWLYRIVYGFWIILTNGFGHTDEFSGLFDHIMALPSIYLTCS